MKISDQLTIKTQNHGTVCIRNRNENHGFHQQFNLDRLI